MEIYRFLPPPLLEGFDRTKVDLDEFLGYVAKARYIQKLEQNLLAQAISEVFAE